MASGSCSKAEATAVVTRLHLGEAHFIPNPVYAVLCGSVMGPGTQTMVVSLASGVDYSTAWSGGGLRCTSAVTGLTCRNKSGHGFVLSRENGDRSDY